MNPDTKEAMIEMAELAAKAIRNEFPDAKPAVKSAHLEAQLLSDKVKNFKIETMCQGFSCECGAGGAIQTKPEHIARYCPICGKHLLADEFGDLPGLKSTDHDEQDSALRRLNYER